MAKQVTILGATGSIGDSTLSILRLHPERFRLFAVTGHSNLQKLEEICREFQPEYAVITGENAGVELQAKLESLGIATRVLTGQTALLDLIRESAADIVVAAIVGAAGLAPTLEAVKTGKRVLLANKEALVMTGRLFMAAVREYEAELLPIDSEHNAIYQCLPRAGQLLAKHPPLEQLGITRILLTASGGPFRTKPLEELAAVTPAQACKHPNWDMGQKISVDSATLMNKGLELIEACWLFGLRAEQVQVHIHPESIVHSLVEYQDGSMLAQLGSPDMRTPISYGLSWPERVDAGVQMLDLFQVQQLNFFPPDRSRFPCLRLAEQCFSSGGTAPAVLNAANEVAVDRFLSGRLGFMEIPNVIEHCLSRCETNSAETLEDVIEADRVSRELANRFCSRILDVQG